MSAKKNKLVLSLFFAGLVSSQTLFAQQNVEDIRDHYYIGLGAGASILKPKINSSAIKRSQDSDFAYKLFGGYQFDDNWAAEVFWTDLGKAKFSSGGSNVGDVKYKAYGAGALYQFPITQNFDVFATTGVGRLHAKSRLTNSQNTKDTFLYAGGGATWNITKTWNLRAEYNYYDKDAQLASLNIVKRFGSATPRRIAKLENKVSQQEKELAIITAGGVAATTVKKQKTCEEFAINLNGVIFKKQSVALTTQAKKNLDDVAEKLKALPHDIHFEIRAHTDDVGTDLYNYALSLARARTVRDYLASHEIALDRIDAQGYGEWRPSNNNNTQSGRDANRRAELVLLGIEKYVKDIGACPVLATPAPSMPR